MAIAIIPAKGTSRRIPFKNRKNFHGKPILAYSIETAKESGLFDRIIVSTDDDEIADIAKEYGAEIHYRSDEDARDEVGTNEIAAIVLDSIEANSDEIACVIYATAPLLKSSMLLDAYEAHKALKYYPYIVPVGEWLVDPGMFYLGEVRAFRMRWPLLGNAHLICIDPRRAIDINTMDDWHKAEQMYEELHNGN